MKLYAVIPCYKTVDLAPLIVKSCLKYVDKVICVDDACPFETGKNIQNLIQDKNLIILFHKNNLGVGGAVKTGFRYALEDGAEIIIKVDSDGQMPPELIPKLVKPIQDGSAEFTKGNRFRTIEVVKKMPKVRLMGNIGLSFLSKLSTGYWELFDPTNGFLAIHKDVLNKIYLDKLDNKYFFETDLLFRCSLLNVVIGEVTMTTLYENNHSSLRPFKEIFNFFVRHLVVFTKRIAYQYFLLDFNPGSISIVICFLFGIVSLILGFFSLLNGHITNQETDFGIQILFLVLTIISSQFFINFVYYDSSQMPILRKFKLIRH